MCMERGLAKKKSLIETNGVAVSEDLTAVIAGGFGFGFDVVFYRYYFLPSACSPNIPHGKG